MYGDFVACANLELTIWASPASLVARTFSLKNYGEQLTSPLARSHDPCRVLITRRCININSFEPKKKKKINISNFQFFWLLLQF